MRSNDNLPPGVTNEMIEDQCRDTCEVCGADLDDGDVRVCSGECARKAAADDAEHWECHDRKAEEHFLEERVR